MIALAAIITLAATAVAQTKTYSFRIDSISDTEFLFVERVLLIQANGNRVANEESIMFDNRDSLEAFATRYKDITVRQRDDAEAAYLMLFNRDSVLGAFIGEFGGSSILARKPVPSPQPEAKPAPKPKPKTRKPKSGKKNR